MSLVKKKQEDYFYDFFSTDSTKKGIYTCQSNILRKDHPDRWFGELYFLVRKLKIYSE
jgi:hypothetical protein